MRLGCAKWIEFLFLFVFQLALFFWIQFGFLAVFTTALVLLIITTHDGLSSSNNPFGVNCKRAPAVTIDTFSIARSRGATASQGHISSPNGETLRKQSGA